MNAKLPILLSLTVATAMLWASCSADDDPSSGDSESSTGEGDSDDPQSVTHVVEFETASGIFTVGLYGNAAPTTVDNFLSYVNQGRYDNGVFHRIAQSPGVIQGGGYWVDRSVEPPNLEPVEAYPAIELEVVTWLPHDKGVLGMAREEDDDSATSQFFINTKRNAGLDSSYASFGEVIDGIEVVETLGALPTGAEMAEFPNDPEQAVILTVTLLD